MVELIILDGRNFNIKDYTFSKNNNIIFDSLVQNSSTFNVNKLDLNVSNNDILITRGTTKQYIGIVDSITKNNNVIKITTYQFYKKLELAFLGKSQVDIVLGDYLKKIIEDNLIKSNDTLQNITYLEVENKSQIRGAVSLTGNSSTNILNVISQILKAYELVINYNATFTESGQLKGIKILIEDVKKEIIIKEKENFITNAEIVDGKIGAVNKLIFFPNEDNILYKDTLTYYLLNDGTVTTNDQDDKRIVPVVVQSVFYQDADIYYSSSSKSSDTLLAKAKEKFSSTTFNHYIKFTINKNNLIDINELNLGDRVKFISRNGKIYNSIITQLKYSSYSSQVEIELGLNRITLTDKLKMRGE